MPPQLCLGTAQFGLDYGISNPNGQICQSEINKIIKKAYCEEINFIDTAQGYGDAEKRLGNTFLMNNKFKIISKLSSSKHLKSKEEIIQIWEDNFQSTLENLKVSKIDSFLIHNLDDLKGLNHKLLMNWLESLKKRSLISKIGLSIYDQKDIQLISLDKFDLIQLPLSIYDQRLLKSGIIRQLKEKEKIIHVRSIFLQGLILENYQNWPSFLSNRFKEHHKNINSELRKRNIDMIYAALSFIYSCDDIDAVLFGVSNFEEFNQIVEIWKSLKENNIDLSNLNLDFSWEFSKDLDPRS